MLAAPKPRISVRRIVLWFALALPLVALALPLALNASSGLSNNALYKRLNRIMDETNASYVGGNVNLTEVVCPLVTAEALAEMYSDPWLKWTVRYKYIEHDNSGIFATPIEQWSIVKPVHPFEIIGFPQILAIMLPHDGTCISGYIHDAL